MNLMNQAKSAIGIDPAYDIFSRPSDDAERAHRIFLIAIAQYSKCENTDGKDIIEYALAEVWHAAKQYYAQHLNELHKLIVL